MPNMTQRDVLNTKNYILAHWKINVLTWKFFRQKWR